MKENNMFKAIMLALGLLLGATMDADNFKPLLKHWGVKYEENEDLEQNGNYTPATVWRQARIETQTKAQLGESYEYILYHEMGHAAVYYYYEPKDYTPYEHEIVAEFVSWHLLAQSGTTELPWLSRGFLENHHLKHPVSKERMAELERDANYLVLIMLNDYVSLKKGWI